MLLFLWSLCGAPHCGDGAGRKNNSSVRPTRSRLTWIGILSETKVARAVYQ